MWCSRTQMGKSFNAVTVYAAGAVIAAVFPFGGKTKPRLFLNVHSF